MSLLAIERPHRLGREEARRRTEKMAEQMRRELAIECDWDGDVLNFRRPGADGHIAVHEQMISIEIRLSMFLVMLRSTLERDVHAYFDHYFE